MNEWIKVVTNPLGLGGFALFLVFSFLAHARRGNERRWLAPVSIGLAATALIGGLALAWTQAHSNAEATDGKQKAPPVPTLNCQSATQTNGGAASPNVNCVQGPVTITIGESSAKSGDQAKPQLNKSQNSK
jgi:hypothetical protein